MKNKYLNFLKENIGILIILIIWVGIIISLTIWVICFGK